MMPSLRRFELSGKKNQTVKKSPTLPRNLVNRTKQRKNRYDTQLGFLGHCNFIPNESSERLSWLASTAHEIRRLINAFVICRFVWFLLALSRRSSSVEQKMPARQFSNSCCCYCCCCCCCCCCLWRTPLFREMKQCAATTASRRSQRDIWSR